MNGTTRPATVKALRGRRIIGLRDGTDNKVEVGDVLTGYLNEYGNFYNEDETYLGSVPLDFEEVADDNDQ